MTDLTGLTGEEINMEISDHAEAVYKCIAELQRRAQPQPTGDIAGLLDEIKVFADYFWSAVPSASRCAKEEYEETIVEMLDDWLPKLRTAVAALQAEVAEGQADNTELRYALSELMAVVEHRNGDKGVVLSDEAIMARYRLAQIAIQEAHDDTARLEHVLWGVLRFKRINGFDRWCMVDKHDRTRLQPLTLEKALYRIALTLIAIASLTWLIGNFT